MILTIADKEVFEALASGRKRYEGRKWKKEFEGLRPGSYIVFLLEGEPELLVAEVEEVVRFKTIAEMVERLWRDLLPFAVSLAGAKKFYSRFYSLDEPAVAIRVRPLLRERIGERELKKWLRSAPQIKS